MKRNMLSLVALMCAFIPLTQIRTQEQTNKIISISPGQILANQPDFMAEETLSVFGDKDDFTILSKLAKKGDTYRRDRDVVITFSKPGKMTLALYPKSKEFIEEPILEDIWFINADNAAIFARKTDIAFEEVGTEIVDGHECIKIKASKKDAATKVDKDTLVLFYAAKDLRHLVIATEVVSPYRKAIYRLKSVSFEVPAEPFLLPSNYRKSNADPIAEYKFVEYFQLTDVKEFSVESARSALLTRIPVSTSEKEIYEFLDRSGIGKDELSSYYRANEKGEIVCRIEYDPKYPGFVKKHFAVLFLLDEQKRLKDIKIKAWRTGL